jgi:uncharacterized membrane protein YGL010W
MRTFDQWMREYAVSHTNPTNVLIHKICVPLIMFSVLGLLWCIPTPQFFQFNPTLNWASIAAAAALCFYFLLNRLMFIGMLVQSVLMLSLCAWLDSLSILLPVSIAIFIVSWFFQFWGHKIEGKKPSFADDIAFLLIGPLWVQRALYRKIGIKA